MHSSPHNIITRTRLAACLLMMLNLIAYPVTAAPIDEFRISDMEQRIRDLETTSREQARLIAQLQAQPGSTRNNSPTTITRSTANAEQRWLSAGNWTRVKTGMSELQVIELLGVPTQVRISSDGRTRSLLYALEVGRSGFLSGKVDMQDSKASNIELPQLK